jgi:hypothetical protein
MQESKSEAIVDRQEEIVAPRRTLKDLLFELSSIERSLDDEDFDPAVVVGDLKEDLALKVDAIRFVVSEYEAYAERTNARADNLYRRAKSATNRAAALEEYVAELMAREKFERLNGNEFFFELRPTAGTVVTKRPPTAGDFVKYGAAFVRHEPEHYEWSKNDLRRAIKAGSTYDFAEIKPGTRLVIDERDRPSVDGAKNKGKKK